MVWDDWMLTDGSAIGGGQSLVRCFTQPFLWHFFRPLVSVSFFFERMLWHGEPLGYHITNLLLHAAGTAVMVRLLLDAFRSKRTALLGGLLFAIHPVQVGAVAWIGGRTDSLASLWVLLMAWMLVRSARAPVAGSGRWLAYAVLFFNLSIYTKEQCLPLLLLAPLAYRTWRSDAGVRLPRTALFAALPFAVSAALFLCAGYYLGMPRPSTLPYSTVEVASLAGATLLHYGALMIAPTPSGIHQLSLPEPAKMGIWPVVVGSLIVVAFVLAVVRLLRRDGPSAWFLCLSALAILPASNLLPLPFLVVAPYRVALPWIGMAAVIGRLIGTGLGNDSGRNQGAVQRILVPAIFAAWVLWAIGLSAWGSLQWRSEVRIFTQFTSRDPRSIVAKNVLTHSLEHVGRFREGAEAEEAALQQVFGSGVWRWGNTAEEAYRKDSHIALRARRNQGTTEDPRIWIAGLYAQLANCRMREGSHDAAKHALEIGNRFWANHVGLHLGFGYYAAQRGDYVEAARRYQMALAIDPDGAAAHSGLGYAYAQQGRWREAVPEYLRWTELEPWNREAKQRLTEAGARASGRAGR